MAIELLDLRIGRAVPFGPKGEPSTIAKLPAGRVRITQLGLSGDEQADARHHGGPDKAVHHYPHEHYAAWRAEFPEHAAHFVAGGFGENISTDGLTEDQACLGDIYRLGSATLQIAQGRKPCWKLNTQFGIDAMARRVHESGRTGWYYRVLEAGDAGPGDALVLLDRPLPAWTVRRLFGVLQCREPADLADLAFLAGSHVLAAGWCELAAKRLDDIG